MSQFKNRTFIRFISFTTFFAFTFTSIVQPLPAQAQVLNPDLKTSNPFSPHWELNLPQELGELESAYFPSAGGRNLFVYYIQEAHSSPEAQQRISEILGFLKKKHRLDLVLTEGASGVLHPEQGAFFTSRAENVKFWNALKQVNLISGVESFLLNHSDIPSFGIENTEHYRENLELYRSVLKEREKTAEFLNRLETLLYRKSGRIFSKETNQFLRQWKYAREQNENLETYLGFLFSASAKRLDYDWNNYLLQFEWPNLIRFNRLMRLGTALKFQEVRQDYERLARMIGGRSPKVTKALGQWVQFFVTENGSFPNGSSEMRFLVEQASEAMAEQGHNLKDFPRLSDYLAFLIFRSEINGDALVRELELLENRLFETFFQTAKQRKLFLVLRDFSILKKAFTLELTRREAKEFRRRLEEFDLARFMQAAEMNGTEAPEQIRHLPGLAARFYDEAERREDDFSKHLRPVSEAGGAVNSIRYIALVAGGYHGEGIQKYLQDKKIPYLAIRPSFSDSSDGKIYQDTLLGFYPALSQLAHARVLLMGLPAAESMMGPEALQQFSRRLMEAYGPFSPRASSINPRSNWNEFSHKAGQYSLHSSRSELRLRKMTAFSIVIAGLLAGGFLIGRALEDRIPVLPEEPPAVQKEQAVQKPADEKKDAPLQIKIQPPLPERVIPKKERYEFSGEAKPLPAGKILGTPFQGETLVLARVSGTGKKLVEAGAFVPKGSPVFQISHQPLEDEIRQLEERLKNENEFLEEKKGKLSLSEELLHQMNRTSFSMRLEELNAVRSAMVIRAPSPMRVTRFLAADGANIEAGTPPFEYEPLNRIWLPISVDQSVPPSVAAFDPFELQVGGRPVTVLRKHVGFDPESKKVILELEVLLDQILEDQNQSVHFHITFITNSQTIEVPPEEIRYRTFSHVGKRNLIPLKSPENKGVFQLVASEGKFVSEKDLIGSLDSKALYGKLAARQKELLNTLRPIMANAERNKSTKPNEWGSLQELLEKERTELTRLERLAGHTDSLAPASGVVSGVLFASGQGVDVNSPIGFISTPVVNIGESRPEHVERMVLIPKDKIRTAEKPPAPDLIDRNDMVLVRLPNGKTILGTLGNFIETVPSSENALVKNSAAAVGFANDPSHDLPEGFKDEAGAPVEIIIPTKKFADRLSAQAAATALPLQAVPSSYLTKDEKPLLVTWAYYTADQRHVQDPKYLNQRLIRLMNVEGNPVSRIETFHYFKKYLWDGRSFSLLESLIEGPHEDLAVEALRLFFDAAIRNRDHFSEFLDFFDGLVNRQAELDRSGHKEEAKEAGKMIARIYRLMRKAEEDTGAISSLGIQSRFNHVLRSKFEHLLLSLVKTEGRDAPAAELLSSAFWLDEELRILYGRLLAAGEKEMAILVRHEYENRKTLVRINSHSPGPLERMMRSSTYRHISGEDIFDRIDYNKKEDQYLISTFPHMDALDSFLDPAFYEPMASSGDPEPGQPLALSSYDSFRTVYDLDPYFDRLTAEQKTDRIEKLAAEGKYEDLELLLNTPEYQAFYPQIVNGMIKNTDGRFYLARLYATTRREPLFRLLNQHGFQSAVERDIFEFIKHLEHLTSAGQTGVNAGHYFNGKPVPAVRNVYQEILLRFYEQAENEKERRAALRLWLAQLSGFQLGRLVHIAVEGDSGFKALSIVVPRNEVEAEARRMLERKTLALFALPLTTSKFGYLEQNWLGSGGVNEIIPGLEADMIAQLGQSLVINSAVYVPADSPGPLALLKQMASKPSLPDHVKEPLEYALEIASIRMSDFEHNHRERINTGLFFQYVRPYVLFPVFIFLGVLGFKFFSGYRRAARDIAFFKRRLVRDDLSDLEKDISSLEKMILGGAESEPADGRSEMRTRTKSKAGSSEEGKNSGTFESVDVYRDFPLKPYFQNWLHFLKKPGLLREEDYGSMLRMAKAILTLKGNGHNGSKHGLVYSSDWVADLNLLDMGSRIKLFRYVTLLGILTMERIRAETLSNREKFKDHELKKRYAYLTAFGRYSFYASTFRWAFIPLVNVGSVLSYQSHNPFIELLYLPLRWIYLIAPTWMAGQMMFHGFFRGRRLFYGRLAQVMETAAQIEPGLYQNPDKILRDSEKKFRSNFTYAAWTLLGWASRNGKSKTLGDLALSTEDQIGMEKSTRFRKFLTRAWPFLFIILPLVVSPLLSLLGFRVYINVMTVVLGAIPVFIVIMFHIYPILTGWQDAFHSSSKKKIDFIRKDFLTRLELPFEEPETYQDLKKMFEDVESERSHEAVKRELSAGTPSADVIVIIDRPSFAGDLERQAYLKKILSKNVRKDIAIEFVYPRAPGTGWAYMEARSQLKERFSGLGLGNKTFHNTNKIFLLAGGEGGLISRFEGTDLGIPLPDGDTAGGILANAYKITQEAREKGSVAEVVTASDIQLNSPFPLKDGINLFASLKNFHNFTRQKFGIVFGYYEKMDEAVKFIDKTDQKGLPSLVRDNEEMSGQIDLTNGELLQWPAFTGMMAAVFSKPENYATYDTLLDTTLKRIEEILEEMAKQRRAEIASGRATEPIRVRPVDLPFDFLIPLIRLAQGDDVGTILKARLKAEPETGRGGFYRRLYRAYEEEQKNNPALFSTPVHVSIPHQLESSFYDVRPYEIWSEVMRGPRQFQAGVPNTSVALGSLFRTGMQIPENSIFFGVHGENLPAEGLPNGLFLAQVPFVSSGKNGSMRRIWGTYYSSTDDGPEGNYFGIPPERFLNGFVDIANKPLFEGISDPMNAPFLPISADPRAQVDFLIKIQELKHRRNGEPVSIALPREHFLKSRISPRQFLAAITKGKIDFEVREAAANIRFGVRRSEARKGTALDSGFNLSALQTFEDAAGLTIQSFSVRSEVRTQPAGTAAKTKKLKFSIKSSGEDRRIDEFILTEIFKGRRKEVIGKEFAAVGRRPGMIRVEAEWRRKPVWEKERTGGRLKQVSRDYERRYVLTVPTRRGEHRFGLRVSYQKQLFHDLRLKQAFDSLTDEAGNKITYASVFSEHAGNNVLAQDLHELVRYARVPEHTDYEEGIETFDMRVAGSDQPDLRVVLVPEALSDGRRFSEALSVYRFKWFGNGYFLRVYKPGSEIFASAGTGAVDQFEKLLEAVSAEINPAIADKTEQTVTLPNGKSQEENSRPAASSGKSPRKQWAWRSLWPIILWAAGIMGLGALCERLYDHWLFPRRPVPEKIEKNDKAENLPAEKLSERTVSRQHEKPANLPAEPVQAPPLLPAALVKPPQAGPPILQKLKPAGPAVIQAGKEENVKASEPQLEARIQTLEEEKARLEQTLSLIPLEMEIQRELAKRLEGKEGSMNPTEFLIERYLEQNHVTLQLKVQYLDRKIAAAAGKEKEKLTRERNESAGRLSNLEAYRKWKRDQNIAYKEAERLPSSGNEEAVAFAKLELTARRLDASFLRRLNETVDMKPGSPEAKDSRQLLQFLAQLKSSDGSAFFKNFQEKMEQNQYGISDFPPAYLEWKLNDLLTRMQAHSGFQADEKKEAVRILNGMILEHRKAWSWKNIWSAVAKQEHARSLEYADWLKQRADLLHAELEKIQRADPGNPVIPELAEAVKDAVRISDVLEGRRDFEETIKREGPPADTAAYLTLRKRVYTDRLPALEKKAKEAKGPPAAQAFQERIHEIQRAIQGIDLSLKDLETAHAERARQKESAEAARLRVEQEYQAKMRVIENGPGTKEQKEFQFDLAVQGKNLKLAGLRTERQLEEARGRRDAAEESALRSRLNTVQMKIDWLAALGRAYSEFYDKTKNPRNDVESVKNNPARLREIRLRWRAAVLELEKRNAEEALDAVQAGQINDRDARRLMNLPEPEPPLPEFDLSPGSSDNLNSALAHFPPAAPFVPLTLNWELRELEEMRRIAQRLGFHVDRQALRNNGGEDTFVRDLGLYFSKKMQERHIESHPDKRYQFLTEYRAALDEIMKTLTGSAKNLPPSNQYQFPEYLWRIGKGSFSISHFDLLNAKWNGDQNQLPGYHGFQERFSLPFVMALTEARQSAFQIGSVEHQLSQLRLKEFHQLTSHNPREQDAPPLVTLLWLMRKAELHAQFAEWVMSKDPSWINSAVGQQTMQQWRLRTINQIDLRYKAAVENFKQTGNYTLINRFAFDMGYGNFELFILHLNHLIDQVHQPNPFLDTQMTQLLLSGGRSFETEWLLRRLLERQFPFQQRPSLEMMLWYLIHSGLKSEDLQALARKEAAAVFAGLVEGAEKMDALFTQAILDEQDAGRSTEVTLDSGGGVKETKIKQNAPKDTPPAVSRGFKLLRSRLQAIADGKPLGQAVPVMVEQSRQEIVKKALHDLTNEDVVRTALTRFEEQIRNQIPDFANPEVRPEVAKRFAQQMASRGRDFTSEEQRSEFLNAFTLFYDAGGRDAVLELYRPDLGRLLDPEWLKELLNGNYKLWPVSKWQEFRKILKNQITQLPDVEKAPLLTLLDLLDEIDMPAKGDKGRLKMRQGFLSRIAHDFLLIETGGMNLPDIAAAEAYLETHYFEREIINNVWTGRWILKKGWESDTAFDQRAKELYQVLAVETRSVLLRVFLDESFFTLGRNEEEKRELVDLRTAKERRGRRTAFEVAQLEGVLWSRLKPLIESVQNSNGFSAAKPSCPVSLLIFEWRLKLRQMTNVMEVRGISEQTQIDILTVAQNPVFQERALHLYGLLYNKKPKDALTPDQFLAFLLREAELYVAQRPERYIPERQKLTDFLERDRKNPVSDRMAPKALQKTKMIADLFGKQTDAFQETLIRNALMRSAGGADADMELRKLDFLRAVFKDPVLLTASFEPAERFWKAVFPDGFTPGKIDRNSLAVSDQTLLFLAEYALLGFDPSWNPADQQAALIAMKNWITRSRNTAAYLESRPVEKSKLIFELYQKLVLRARLEPPALNILAEGRSDEFEQLARKLIHYFAYVQEYAAPIYQWSEKAEADMKKNPPAPMPLNHEEGFWDRIRPALNAADQARFDEFRKRLKDKAPDRRKPEIVKAPEWPADENDQAKDEKRKAFRLNASEGALVLNGGTNIYLGVAGTHRLPMPVTHAYVQKINGNKSRFFLNLKGETHIGFVLIEAAWDKGKMTADLYGEFIPRSGRPGDGPFLAFEFKPEAHTVQILDRNNETVSINLDLPKVPDRKTLDRGPNEISAYMIHGKAGTEPAYAVQFPVWPEMRIQTVLEADERLGPEGKKPRYLLVAGDRNAAAGPKFYHVRIISEKAAVPPAVKRSDMRRFQGAGFDAILASMIEHLGPNWRDVKPYLQIVKRELSPEAKVMLRKNRRSFRKRLSQKDGLLFSGKFPYDPVQFEPVYLLLQAVSLYILDRELGRNEHVIEQLDQLQKLLKQFRKSYQAVPPLSVPELLIHSFSADYGSKNKAVLNRFVLFSRRLNYLPGKYKRAIALNIFFTGIHLADDFIKYDNVDIQSVLPNLDFAVRAVESGRGFEDLTPDLQVRLRQEFKLALFKFFLSTGAVIINDPDRHPSHQMQTKRHRRVFDRLSKLPETLQLREFTGKHAKNISAWMDEVVKENPEHAAFLARMQWYFYLDYYWNHYPPEWNMKKPRPSLGKTLINPEWKQNKFLIGSVPILTDGGRNQYFRIHPWRYFAQAPLFKEQKQVSDRVHWLAGKFRELEPHLENGGKNNSAGMLGQQSNFGPRRSEMREEVMRSAAKQLFNQMAHTAGFSREETAFSDRHYTVIDWNDFPSVSMIHQLLRGLPPAHQVILLLPVEPEARAFPDVESLFHMGRKRLHPVLGVKGFLELARNLNIPLSEAVQIILPQNVMVSGRENRLKTAFLSVRSFPIAIFSSRTDFPFIGAGHQISLTLEDFISVWAEARKAYAHVITST